jgi:phosphohistidine phosphatase
VELLIVRHAIAEDRRAFAARGRDDAERPLTEEGRRKMERAARGVGRAAPEISALASSPLVRAVETARILLPALGLERFEELGALAPDSAPEALVPWLRSAPGAPGGAVAVVGHEPHLSTLVAWLVSGRTTPLTELRKGGACLVGFSRRPGRGTGSLRWLLTASQLRRLGR